MSQPVHVVNPPSGEGLWILIYAIPACAAAISLGYFFWIGSPDTHPVIKMAEIGVACLVVASLVSFRVTRVLYAMAVLLAGAAIIHRLTPDALWMVFWDLVFLGIWA